MTHEVEDHPTSSEQTRAPLPRGPPGVEGTGLRPPTPAGRAQKNVLNRRDRSPSFVIYPPNVNRNRNLLLKEKSLATAQGRVDHCHRRQARDFGALSFGNALSDIFPDPPFLAVFLLKKQKQARNKTRTRIFFPAVPSKSLEKAGEMHGKTRTFRTIFGQFLSIFPSSLWKIRQFSPEVRRF